MSELGMGEVIFVAIARGGFHGGAILKSNMSEGGITNGGAAWVGKAENFGDFVEAFADGIVAGGADDFEIVVLLHVNDLSMAATYD